MTTDTPESDGRSATDVAGERSTLLLHRETVAIAKRTRRTRVRASRTTDSHPETTIAELNHEHVVVERVAIGRVVDAIPPIRQEGDTTIMPVVEEELVVTRRLVLKEEVRLRRARGTTTHSETVVLRKQRVTVVRTALDD